MSSFLVDTELVFYVGQGEEQDIPHGWELEETDVSCLSDEG